MLTGLVLATMAFSNQPQQYAFMPKNDLHLEDRTEKSEAGKKVFDLIIDKAIKVYTPIAESRGERLVFNRKWSDSTVNAYMSRRWGQVEVTMFGGLFRRSEVTPEAFALVVCHELGHAYGGTPYLRPGSQISAEGQSDYYGNKTCMRLLMNHFEKSPEAIAMDLPFAEEVCEEENDECDRLLKAGYGLGRLLGNLMGEDVQYETPDESIVTTTELSYPKTAQCRLDTYRAGALNQPRPLCWYKPEDKAEVFW